MYLDNAATTNITQEVKEYIFSIIDEYYNPSSIYSKGQGAKKIINQARENVANFINGQSNNVIFTSSGSASNSLVIRGLLDNDIDKARICVYSPTAHKSMINACKAYNGIPLQVNQYGEIKLEYLDELINHLNKKSKIPIVCIEYANSEIGTINNIKDISNIIHNNNGFLIVDATGYIPTCQLTKNDINMIDYITFSGHKLHALKGVGVLYINNQEELNPLIYGSQEKGLFAGTENILGIASLGKAVEKYGYSTIVSDNRDYVYEYIKKNIQDVYLVGSKENRTPHNLYICIKGIEGESLTILLDMNDIQVSTGSACANNDSESETLIAINIPKTDINSCIRVTFNGNETKKELDYFCSVLEKNIKLLRDCRGDYNED